VDPELRLALQHLGGRRVVDLTALVYSARRAGASPEKAVERWLQRGAAADDTWMLEDPDSPIVRRWVAELGVPDQSWRTARARLRLGRGPTLEADGVVIKEPITLRRLEVNVGQDLGQ
jgi:hypothetical protein